MTNHFLQINPFLQLFGTPRILRKLSSNNIGRGLFKGHRPSYSFTNWPYWWDRNYLLLRCAWLTIFQVGSCLWKNSGFFNLIIWYSLSRRSSFTLNLSSLRSKGEQHCFSFDLKSATDRWPLVFIFESLKVLFDRSFASAVVNYALEMNLFRSTFTRRKSYL